MQNNLAVTDLQARALSRRQLLTGAAALGAGAFAWKGLGSSSATNRAQGLRHLVWVWQFATDAEPDKIGASLRGHNLGILLKTHDGVQWMSRYDKSTFAVSGPAQVQALSGYFEDAGVPFHAWAVVKGVDPIREARMAADVLAAGARSLFLDLEPHSGFWVGTPADAIAYGNELRRLQPDAWIVTSMDPRPWVLSRTPMVEFAAFSNELAPQNYWRSFDTPANHTRYAESGFPLPPEGMSPEFLNFVGNHLLSGYNLPITPVGQGATTNSGDWHRFIDNAFDLGSYFVSAWRFGVSNADVFRIMRDRPARQPIVAVANAVYVVKPGDTLSKIAAEHGTTVAAIAELNGITNVNLISVGQELQIPGGGQVAVSTAQSSPAPAPSASGQTYVVQSGDTLSGIASRFGTTVQRLADINGISNVNLINVGQQLTIG
jgi:LysM repeat protein